MSNAGDVNGDNFDDVIVGAPSVDHNGYSSGSSYVVFGKSSVFDATLNLSQLNGNNGFRFDGAHHSGRSISHAGDINGDGYDDVIVGSDGQGTIPYNYSSSSYVVFGKASGFEVSLNLSALDGSNGFSLYGPILYSSVAQAVSTAGDINGDGLDDLIIGARGAEFSGTSGSVYVIFGRTSGFDPKLDLLSLDGSNGFRIDGADYLIGGSVSSAGDINGDGLDDLIFGASNASYVLFGKASGFDAEVYLGGLDITDGFLLKTDDYQNSGRSVSSAGDINGDGFDDLIVGAPLASQNGDESGSSYVVFGRNKFTSDEAIMGTSGDDVLEGTTSAEIFEAGDGNDVMIGRGGADEYYGGNGVDQIKVTDLNFALVDGGSGNDILHTTAENLNLDLTDYVDKIQGIETICLYGQGDNTMVLTGAELQALSDTSDNLKVHGNAGDRVILEGHWVDEGSRGFYHAYTQDDAVLLVGMNMMAVIA